MSDSANTTNRFDEQLATHDLHPLRARTVGTLQVNVGKLCNQACRHCHVDAGPHQSGGDVNMGAEVADRVIALLEQHGPVAVTAQTGTNGHANGNVPAAIHTVDLTGGAPELNPHFRRIVEAARQQGIQVMDRCNLSVLFEPGQEDLADFLAHHRVEVVASLPFYRKDRTDRQRGAGVFDASIEGLRKLNELGYGDGRSGLVLNLVYNPVGAYLPGDQAQLEADYKRELERLFGIRFDHLFCITNMPIARFLDWLRRSGNENAYVQKLLDAFNPGAATGVMCRDLVSIGPDGAIYDCDFNQMMNMPVGEVVPRNIRDFDWARLASREIVTGEHCLGCTAGAGSSCGGTTA